MATIGLHSLMGRAAANRDDIERYVDARFREAHPTHSGLAVGPTADTVAPQFETHATNMGDYWKLYVFTNAPAVSTAMSQTADLVKEELEREGVATYIDVQARPGTVLVPRTR